MVTQTLVAAMADLEKRLRAQARDITEVRRLVTVSGIVPITALAYRAAMADPTRFAHSRDIGAYLGLIPRLDELDSSGPVRAQGARAPRGAGGKGFGESRPPIEGSVIGSDHRDLVL